MKRLSLDFQTVMSAIAVLGMMLAVAGTWPPAEGLSILVVDKTLSELLPVADRCVVLENGRSVWSGKPADLINAFKQSIELYPLSPESNFRLAQMYMNMQRFEDAENLIRNFAEQDPANESAKGFLGQIENTRRMGARRMEIEKKQQETQ